MDTAEFQKRMDALGLKQRDLAEAIDLGADKVSKIFSGVRQWKGVELTKAIAWIEAADAAKGSSAAASRPLDMKRAPEQMPTRGTHDDVGAVKLRSLNLDLAMGDGTDLEDWFDETEVSFDANWLNAVSSSPYNRLIMGRGVGDSMKPSINDHDDVLIDLNENQLKRGDRIYALTIDGAGAVKRLIPSPQKGMVEVISDNPEHPSRVRTYPKEMIRIIGRVVWSGRRH